MSEYDNPRPTAGTPYSDPCAVKDMSITLGKLMEDSGGVTTYNGKSLMTLTEAIDKFGFGVAPFTFADGGTLSSFNLLVSNSPADNFFYKYIGNGVAPLVIAPSFNPVGSVSWEKSVATDAKFITSANVTVSGIKNLVVPTVTGQSFSVTGFYSGTTVGGGNFIWDASKDKATHNGGTIIAPEAIAAWDGSATNIATLLNWTGTGSGCFVRVSVAGLTNSEISIEMFGGSGDGVADCTLPFKAALKVCVKGSPIVLSSDSKYVISDESETLGSHLAIVGQGAYSSRFIVKITDANKFFLRIKPADLAGNAITGLLLKDFGVEFKWNGVQSPASLFNMEGIFDAGKVENVRADRIGGHAVRFHQTNTNSYNIVEGLVFDNFIMIGCDKSDLAATKELIRHQNSMVVNEVYFRECKFYMNRTGYDLSSMNPRAAVNSLKGYGWSFSGCSFVSTFDVPVLSFGFDDAGTVAESRGHRLTDNMYENINKSVKTDKDCCLARFGDSARSTKASNNFIKDNRFEFPVSPDIHYYMACSFFSIDSPASKQSDIVLPTSSTAGASVIIANGDSTGSRYNTRVSKVSQETAIQGGVLAQADGRLGDFEAGNQRLRMGIRRLSDAGVERVAAYMDVGYYTGSAPNFAPQCKLIFNDGTTAHNPAQFRNNIWRFTPIAGTLPSAAIWDDGTSGGGSIAYSSADDRLKVHNNTEWKTIQVVQLYTTTTALANAGKAGGIQAFNVTTNKPIWSDGTNWRYADGTILV